jgi:hypothetical protein
VSARYTIIRTVRIGQRVGRGAQLCVEERQNTKANQIAVIAGEPEGSWLAGGQQEGLQYSGGSAWCSVAQRSAA